MGNTCQNPRTIHSSHSVQSLLSNGRPAPRKPSHFNIRRANIPPVKTDTLLAKPFDFQPPRPVISPVIEGICPPDYPETESEFLSDSSASNVTFQRQRQFTCSDIASEPLTAHVSVGKRVLKQMSSFLDQSGFPESMTDDELAPVIPEHTTSTTFLPPSSHPNLKISFGQFNSKSLRQNLAK